LTCASIRPKGNASPQCENAAVLPAAFASHQMLEIYFDTDFLNMRSIFSLIASMAVEFD
jgi:hypothetical protein